MTYYDLTAPKPNYGELAVYGAIVLLCVGIIGMAWGVL